jgi:hypothetical protein
VSRAEGDAARPAEETSAPVIGLLNQRSLHAAIREWYARSGDRFEQKVDGAAQTLAALWRSFLAGKDARVGTTLTA